MVWYSHLMIHTVKGFRTVNEAEVDVFLEFPCWALINLIVYMMDITRSPWACQKKKKSQHFPSTLQQGGMWPVVANEMGVEVMWVIIRLNQWKASAWLFSSLSSPAEISVDTWLWGSRAWADESLHSRESLRTSTDCIRRKWTAVVLSHWCFRIVNTA